MNETQVPDWFVNAMENGRVPIGFQKPEPYYPDGYQNMIRAGENFYATDGNGNQFEFVVKAGRLLKRNKLTAG